MPLRSLSQDENIKSLGGVNQRDKLREVDSGSPTPTSSPLSSPEPVSSEEDDDPQESELSPKFIIHESCLAKDAPSCDKAKAKFDELGKLFPSDLPYIITYEGKSLKAICQECVCRLQLEGSALGGLLNHASSVGHGLKVTQRIVQNNLEEISTFRVSARRKAMDNLSKPRSSRKFKSQRKLQTEKLRDSSSAEYEPAEPFEHSELETRKSKRRKLAPAFLAETDTSDLPISTGLKNPVGRPRGWRERKESPSVVGTSAQVPERIAADISERFTDINHQFDHKMKKQRDHILLLNADLIGLRNFHGKRLDTLEQISETQKHKLKVNNGHLMELKAQNDASFQKDTISLADMKSTLEERKESIDNLTKLLSNAECKLEGQKKDTNNLAELFTSMESNLNEQKKVVEILASKLESDLERQKETTASLAELSKNRLNGQKQKIDHLMIQLNDFGNSRESEDMLQLRTENELQTFHKQIEILEQKISGSRHDATEEVAAIIKERYFPHISVDRIEKVENSIEELNRRLVDPFPADTFKVIVDRLVGHTAENHNRLEEMLREFDKRHLSQRASATEALETKISCTSQASINRVVNLEGSLKEIQTKLADMAGLAVEPHLQCSKQYAELLEKQAVELRPYMDRIVRLEEEISNFRSLRDKLDSLETCTQGFQKWLEEMACESAEYRLQQDNSRTEFLKRQTLESQTFKERIVNLEKNTTYVMRLMKEDKMSGEPMRKCMSNFRSTTDQITELSEKVNNYDSKLGAVSMALDNRRLQQLKEHTELIEEKMSHTQKGFDNMAIRLAGDLSDIAIQAAKSEIIGKNSSRDHQIDDLVQSIRPIMLRLASLEGTEKRSDEMLMLRLAALEEKNERQVSRIVELERGNESLEREVMKLRQPIVG